MLRDSGKHGEPKILPCLDICGGEVVKGQHFANLRKAGDPVEIARKYAAEGADELVFLDITATEERRGTLLPLVRKVAAACSIPLTVGGGIDSVAAAREVLDAGAARVSVNSAAIRRPELVSELVAAFGAENVIVAIDARARESGGYEVVIQGGKMPTGRDAVEWARQVAELGAGAILLTSMDRDGINKGYDLPMTRAVADAVDIPVIASGGAGVPQDFIDVLSVGGAASVLAAGIFHFDRLSIPELRACLYSAGLLSSSPLALIGADSADETDRYTAGLCFNSQDLIPAIAVDAKTNEVLMLAWQNKEAITATLKSGLMHYYSRSRREQWLKGLTSGHLQRVCDILLDCDRDTLLYRVEQRGAACHLGTRSCFARNLLDDDKE